MCSRTLALAFLSFACLEQTYASAWSNHSKSESDFTKVPKQLAALSQEELKGISSSAVFQGKVQGRRLLSSPPASLSTATKVSLHKSAIVFLEVDDSGGEVFRNVLHDASQHYGLKFCGVDCERRARWHRSAKWRQACRTLVGSYVMGMCPGKAYFTGEDWVPCRSAVSLRHPVDRVLATYLSCHTDGTPDKCAGHYLDANMVGYRRWAEHHKSFVLLKLAQDRENILGPSHPDACTNPAGCVHDTPCWYKHHQHVELEGNAHQTFEKAMARLKEMDFVLIYERFAESLKLFECRTGLSTLGHRERRKAVTAASASHGKKGKSGGSSDASVVTASVGGSSGVDGLGSFASVSEEEKFSRWRQLMRKDPEVLDTLHRELVLYDTALGLFEKQLVECGISRNGSKVTMDESAPAHVRPEGSLLASMVASSSSSPAASLAERTVKAAAEEAVSDLYQRLHARRKRGSQSGGADGGPAESREEGASPTTTTERGRIKIIENRRRRGGLSRVHQEKFKSPGGLDLH